MRSLRLCKQVWSSACRFVGHGALASGALAAIAACAPVAHANDISFLLSFGSLSYHQTGDDNTLSLNGAFYSASVATSTPNPYTTVTMTYPGPLSPVALTQSDSTTYSYQTGFYPSLADMEADFPFGTYSFTADNGDMASYDYTADDYAGSLPYLAGSTYSQLQGMDASQPFTFNFSPFVTGSSATHSIIFFTIYDEDLHQTVEDAGFLPADTSSVTLPGGTLKSGDLFSYELIFSNRDDLTSGFSGGDFPPELAFDLRTEGTFGTAAGTPEPSSVALFGLGSFALAIFMKRSAVKA